METTTTSSIYTGSHSDSLVRKASLRRRHSFSLRPRSMIARRRWKRPPQVQNDEGVFLDANDHDHEPQKKKKEQVLEALPVPVQLQVHSWMAVLHKVTSQIQIAELWPDSGIFVISKLQMPVQTPTLQQWNGLIVPGLQVLSINEEPVVSSYSSSSSLTQLQDRLQDPQMYPLRLRLSGSHVFVALSGFTLPGRRRRGTLLFEDLTLGTTTKTNDVRLVEIQHVLSGGRYDTGNLQAGMVMTNANGKVLVGDSIRTSKQNNEEEQEEDVLVSTLSQRLQQQPKALFLTSAPRPYCVALDISPAHQARLQDEVQQLPVLPLPPSLHAKLYQSLVQASTTTTLPPRRSLSLPTVVVGKEQPQSAEMIQRFKELYQSSFAYNASGIPSPFAKASSDSSCLFLLEEEEEQRQNQNNQNENNEDDSFHTQGTSSMSSFWNEEQDCLSPSASFSSMARLSRRLSSPLQKKASPTTKNGSTTGSGSGGSSPGSSPFSPSLQRKASIHAQRRLSFQDSSAVLSITLLEEPEEEEEEDTNETTKDDPDHADKNGNKKKTTTFPQISLLHGKTTTTPLDCPEEEEHKEDSAVTTTTTTPKFEKGDSRLGGLDFHLDLDDDDDSSSSSLSHTLFEDKDEEDWEEEEVSAGDSSSHAEEEEHHHHHHKLTSTEKTAEDEEEEEDDEEEDLETSLSPRRAPIRLLTDTIRAQNYVQRRFAQVDHEQDDNNDNDNNTINATASAVAVTTPAAPVLQRRSSFRVSPDGHVAAAATTGSSSSTTTQESNQTTTASSSLSADWSYRDEPAAAEQHEGFGLVVHSQEFLKDDAQNQQVDRIRILFEKTSVTHRLGLILQQDGNNAQPIVIRRILPRGVFGTSSLKSSFAPQQNQILQEGDVLLEIQGDTPTTPLQAFESLVRCTGSMCSMVIERKRYL